MLFVELAVAVADADACPLVAVLPDAVLAALAADEADDDAAATNGLEELPPMPAVKSREKVP